MANNTTSVCDNTGIHRTNTNRAVSPPAQSHAQSKRDKKRSMLEGKLQNMTELFSRDRDRQYREELQRIQLDTSLVSRLDPYADRPLDDIHREYRELSQPSVNAHTPERHTRSLLEMAGPSFEDFVHKVEDLVERRDFDVTSHKAEYDAKLRAIKNEHAYKIEIARREHEALSNTLRDRLINTVLNKKHRLNREKDAAEIADHTALLLHPNQFSLTNPASPSGVLGKRATRLRREVEDLPGASDHKRRKRNAGDDDGSPAPKGLALDKHDMTPLWQNDNKIRELRKEDGHLFSVDKLFTDKELSMAHNEAARAVHLNVLARRDAQGNVMFSSDESENGDAGLNEGGKDEELVAPTMDRQPSHATRSTRGGQTSQQPSGDQLLGVEGLPSLGMPGHVETISQLEPKLPPLLQAHYTKAWLKTESNTATSLSAEDVQEDVRAMNLLSNYQKEHGVGANLDVPHGGRKLLEAMLPPLSDAYAAIVQTRPRPSIERLGESLGVPVSSLLEEPMPANTPGGLAPSPAPPLSRQSSFGGVDMSRCGSGRGKRRAA